MIAEVSEAQELYLVFGTTFVMIAVIYFLGKWWTSFR